MGTAGEVAAVAGYRRAVELRPSQPEAWYNLGNAYSDLGHRRQAVRRRQADPFAHRIHVVPPAADYSPATTVARRERHQWEIIVDDRRHD